MSVFATFLLAIASASPEGTDAFGRCVRGIADVNGDGVDDLLVGDAGYNFGTLWTVSGKDGKRIAVTSPDPAHLWLGGSFFVTGDEVCACVSTPDGPQLEYFACRTLTPGRASAVVREGKGFFAWVECAGDIDGDGVLDAALCVVPGGNEGCRIELVSGKSGKSLRTIPVGLSRCNSASAVATLGDLDGDGVPELGVGTGYCFPADQRHRVFVFSGKTGTKLGELLGHEGKSGFGAALGAVRDLDGDGVDDIVLVDDAQGAVQLYSGKTRAFVRALPGTWEVPGAMELGNVTTLRDLDGDGVLDFGMTLDTFPAGEARVYSGKTGALIRVHGSSSFPSTDGYPACIADVGDLDHDGRCDYAVGTSHHLAGDGTSSVTAFSGATGKKLWVIDERSLTRAP